MNVNISDLIVKVNNSTQSINWIEALITVCSVFLGAFLAYRFSRFQDSQKKKDEEIEAYCILSNYITYFFNNLLSYKKDYLDKIELSVSDERNFYNYRLPDFDFIIDVDEYIFISKFNSSFLYSLRDLQKKNKIIKEALEKYNQILTDIGKTNNNFESFREFHSSVIVAFDDLYTYTYFLIKQFNKCYARYLNIYFYENIEKSFLENPHINEYLPNAKAHEDYLKWESEFDKHWVKKPNFWCFSCFLFRKWKYRIRASVEFFKKPQNCKFECLKDIKEEKE